VQERAAKILNARSDVIFLKPDQMISETMMVDEARNAGKEIITIPENLRDRIRGQADISGNPIRELDRFYEEYHESFQFKFVAPKELTDSERIIFDATDRILELIGGKPEVVTQIVVSETMHKEQGTFVEAEGLWEPTKGRIVVKRSTLQSLEKYAGTLLHEVAHARSGASDVSRDFELELTRLLGLSSFKALKARS
ncbi:MAG: ATP-binding protein, partial [Nitrososphaera sp.]